jgi:acyl carrier protein
MTIEEFARELESNIDSATPGSIQPDSRFREFAWWDSLAALTTLAVFDSCFGRQITGEQLAACQTIADIHALSRPS